MSNARVVSVLFISDT